MKKRLLSVDMALGWLNLDTASSSWSSEAFQKQIQLAMVPPGLAINGVPVTTLIDRGEVTVSSYLDDGSNYTVTYSYNTDPYFEGFLKEPTKRITR